MVSIETALQGRRGGAGDWSLWDIPCQVWAYKLHQNPTFHTHWLKYQIQYAKSNIQNTKSTIRRPPLPSVSVKALPKPAFSIHHLPIHQLLSLPYFVIMNTIVWVCWSLLSNLTLYLWIHCPLFSWPYSVIRILSVGVEVSCQITHHVYCLFTIYLFTNSFLHHISSLWIQLEGVEVSCRITHFIYWLDKYSPSPFLDHIQTSWVTTKGHWILAQSLFFTLASELTFWC